MNVAMILAGGVGKRMGATIPKQFIKVLGKPIIIYTLQKFEKNKDIDAIQVVCVGSYMDEIAVLIKNYNISKVKWIVVGGESFQNSVKNGLIALKPYCKDDDIVMIHMSVAPLIEEEILNDSIAVCKEKGNAISVNPCLLYMGTRDNDEYSSKSVLREGIIGLNTPQTFHFGELYNAYKYAMNEGYLDELEPHTTSLMYKLGKRLYFSKGSQLNIKITTKDDLDFFEAYCIMKQMKGKN